MDPLDPVNSLKFIGEKVKTPLLFIVNLVLLIPLSVVPNIREELPLDNLLLVIVLYCPDVSPEAQFSIRICRLEPVSLLSKCRVASGVVVPIPTLPLVVASVL